MAQVVAVVGPTASGKSDVGVAVARALGGEVVNADSMQLYRGMDIGTAKPTPEERGGIPHHLLDLWHVRQPASESPGSFAHGVWSLAITASGRLPRYGAPFNSPVAWS